TTTGARARRTFNSARYTERYAVTPLSRRAAHNDDRLAPARIHLNSAEVPFPTANTRAFPRSRRSYHRAGFVRYGRCGHVAPVPGDVKTHQRLGVARCLTIRLGLQRRPSPGGTTSAAWR